MNPMQAVTAVLQRTFDFQGRSIRSEFWWFMLFYMVVYVLIAAMTDFDVDETFNTADLVTLILWIPSLAVQIRRLHDTDRSGWWIFISLVPLIGFILLIIWSAQRGTHGDNRFGPDFFEDRTPEVFD